MVGPPPTLAERRAEFERSAQRAHKAKKFRKWLPIGIGIFVLALLAWPLFFASETGLTLSTTDITNTEKQLSMTKPRFSGMDEKGHPFLITADSGVQDKARAELVTLRQVQADMTQLDGSWITLVSPWAYFRPRPELLDLPNPVQIYSSNGYQLNVNTARISLNDKIATSPGPVNGTALFGAFRSDTMMLDLNNSSLHFDGNVKLRFDPAEAQAAKQAQGQMERPRT